MKKLFATLIVVVLAISAVIGLVACDVKYPEEIKKAIEAAATMTDEELAAASKAEFDADPNAKFNADSLTSSVKNAMSGFAAKYDWIVFNGTEKVTLKDDNGNPILDANGKEQTVEVTKEGSNIIYNSKKGSEYQPKLTAAAKSGSYIADFVMIQDASFVDSLVSKGFLLSHVPTGSNYSFDKEDTTPIVGLTFNKIFMQNKTGENFNQLKNVWQLTGQDGKTLKKIDYVSYQSPLSEDINMNFLIMLTSDDACAKLTTAYKSYFGKDYVANKDYKNIGYEFVAKFCQNMKLHKSDSTEIKEINKSEKLDGRVIFAGLCKLKDYAGYSADTTDPTYFKNVVSAAGYNNDVEGFPGFIYNMWTLIPATCKMPYTACLFTRYMLSQEGYTKACKDVIGYYSPNKLVSSAKATALGDPALSVWKSVCITEDYQYINKNYKTMHAFINQQMTARPDQGKLS